MTFWKPKPMRRKSISLYTKKLSGEELRKARKELFERKVINDGFKEYMAKHRLSITKDDEVEFFPGSISFLDVNVMINFSESRKHED